MQNMPLNVYKNASINVYCKSNFGLIIIWNRYTCVYEKIIRITRYYFILLYNFRFSGISSFRIPGWWLRKCRKTLYATMETRPDKHWCSTFAVFNTFSMPEIWQVRIFFKIPNDFNLWQHGEKSHKLNFTKKIHLKLVM